MFTRLLRGGIAALGILLLLPGSVRADAPPVPDWELDCVDGSRVGFHRALEEGPVLVSFWALWCKPCLKELPHLDRLAKDYEGRLSVLAVNIDSQRSISRVRPFLRSKGYGLQVPLDTAGDLARQMQVGKIVPYLVLYDGSGEVVYRHRGYREGDEIALAQQIEELLSDDGDDE